jgi:hypothetical protein
VDFLAKVAAPLGIGFVTRRQAVQSETMRFDGSSVEFPAPGLAHITNSRPQREFLTGAEAYSASSRRWTALASSAL